MVLFFETPNFTSQDLSKYNITSLNVDEAIINITSTLKKKLWMYVLSSECYKCPFTKLYHIDPNSQKFSKIDTTYDVIWKFYHKDQGPLVDAADRNEFCKLEAKLGEFGIYDILVEDPDQCKLTTVNEPVDTLLPLLLILLVFLIFVATIQIKNIINNRKLVKQQSETDNELQPADIVEKENIKQRLKSLDTFRGISIVLMIFVNSGGGHYWWIEHATWNGIHIADFVFPFFLWIMGVCIPISIKSQLRRNVSKKEMFFNVSKRSLTLFAMGVCLNTVSGSKLENLRIFGVLQRFGFAYFFVTMIYIIFSKNIDVLPQNRYKQMFLDIILLGSQWIFMLGLLAVYLILLFYFPVPECPTGYLGPGGKHDNAIYKDCIGGVTGYFDRSVLGLSHIYQHPTARYVYDSMPFDPEGIFGCLPTIFHTFLGVQCGMVLIIFSNWKQRIMRWLTWGTTLGILGGILCKFQKEDGWIPVNKNLWSLSYVFITCCCAFYLLSLCYFIIDVHQIWSGTPFFYSGMNAILMYIGHTITHKMLPWHWQIGEMNTHFILLFESLWNTVLWMVIAFELYRRKIFYSV